MQNKFLAKRIKESGIKPVYVADFTPENTANKETENEWWWLGNKEEIEFDDETEFAELETPQNPAKKERSKDAKTGPVNQAVKTNRVYVFKLGSAEEAMDILFPGVLDRIKELSRDIVGLKGAPRDLRNADGGFYEFSRLCYPGTAISFFTPFQFQNVPKPFSNPFSTPKKIDMPGPYEVLAKAGKLQNVEAVFIIGDPRPAGLSDNYFYLTSNSHLEVNCGSATSTWALRLPEEVDYAFEVWLDHCEAIWEETNARIAAIMCAKDLIAESAEEREATFRENALPKDYDKGPDFVNEAAQEGVKKFMGLYDVYKNYDRLAMGDHIHATKGRRGPDRTIGSPVVVDGRTMTLTLADDWLDERKGGL